MSSLADFIHPLKLSPEILSSLARGLCDTYRDLAANSIEQFLATPVNVLPTGSETGRFLAIDIGGSNVRVGFVELLGGSELRRSYDQSWPIGDHFKMDKAEDLFLWIGGCIAQVINDSLSDAHVNVSDSDPLGHVLPLGIAWSFPLIQKSISDATIMPMGKGFAIKSDLNLSKLLLGGYQRHLDENRSKYSYQFPSLRIAAITNDTLATLASLSYTAKTASNRKVAMGLIVGTGTNAAIPMKSSALHQLKKESMDLPVETNSLDPTVVVNTEWSIHGTAKPLRELDLITKWDKELDKNDEAPGYMPFEYMAGGRYLGEIVRLVAYDYFVNVKATSSAQLPFPFLRRNALETILLSKVIATNSTCDELIPELERNLPPPCESTWCWTPENAESIRAIAEAVQERSAKMVAAAVVGALACVGDLALRSDIASSHPKRLHCEELIVAYTGGVISQYPRYLETCQAAINNLIEALSDGSVQQQVSLSEVLNGGVIGAGVLAGTVWNLPTKKP